METSINEGLYENRDTTVHNMSQSLIMDANEMYSNSVTTPMEYEHSVDTGKEIETIHGVYDIKANNGITVQNSGEISTEMSQQVTQEYYSVMSHSDEQHHNTGNYTEYVVQQTTEVSYIDEQSVNNAEYTHDQFLQITTVPNEQTVVSNETETPSEQYVESTDNTFTSQYISEKTEVVHENIETINESVAEVTQQTENVESLDVNHKDQVSTVKEHLEQSQEVTVVEEHLQPPETQAASVEETAQTAIVEDSDVYVFTEDGEPAEVPLEEATETTEAEENQSNVKKEVKEEHSATQKQEDSEFANVREDTLVANSHMEQVVQIISDEEVPQSAAEELVDNPDPVAAPEGSMDSGTDHPTTEQENVDVQETRTRRQRQQPTPGNRRTRKSPLEVPMHVLGHNVSKPVEHLPNGRQLPKPRLGVKVPYRNLTSQMVTKAEIEQEILERSKQKQVVSENQMFARSLTQRLFKKITENEGRSSASDGATKSTKKDQITKPADTPQDSKIQNDSDLLAILEGDDEDILMVQKTTTTPQLDESNLKALEREIALQQLQELPQQVVRRQPSARDCKVTPKKRPPTASGSTEGSSGKENATTATSSPTKSASSTKQEITTSEQRSPKKPVADVEPQVKVNMVLKTYSRKRKAEDTPDVKPEAKKPNVEEQEVKKEDSSGVYVTKSSRVIKKKIIWDPDEVTTVRSPKPKPAEPAPATPKPAEKSPEKKPIEKKTTPEKPVKKVTVIKKVIAEKPAVKTVVKSGKIPLVKPKKTSEIDRLLMDEGAVKMLYDLKTNDDGAVSPTKKKKGFVSVERAQKEIMKKANQIKNDLEQSSGIDVTKALRKKEGIPTTPSPVKPGQVTQERKMSKDSVRSSVHTPPSSPFMHHGQGSSMLIRRRSSSSISSSDDVESDTTKTSKKSKKSKRSLEELKTIERDPLELEPVVDNVDIKPKPSSSNKLLSIKKVNKQVNVELNYQDNKCLLTEQILDELTSTVKKYGKDKDCNILCITSNNKAFCLGLDYASLVVSDDKERKDKAANLAGKVRDFLLSLLHFPKVLVAGIQGECAGLAVTMLPLFDTVIASDGAFFSAPYVRLGCIPEAGCLLGELGGLAGHRLASDLFYTGDKITADDACKRGLVSKLCWPEKYKETLRNTLTAISKGSRQSLLTSKKQLQSHTFKQTELSLENEWKIWADLWSSQECQKNFSEIGHNG